MEGCSTFQWGGGGGCFSDEESSFLSGGMPHGWALVLMGGGFKKNRRMGGGGGGWGRPFTGNPPCPPPHYGKLCGIWLFLQFLISFQRF